MSRWPRALGAALLVTLAACGEPTAPPAQELELRVRSGDGAVGLPGEDIRFEAVVVTVAEGTPRAEVAVLWSVRSGDATLRGSTGAISDSVGVVAGSVRLGSTPGPVRVEATLRDDPLRTARFEAVTAARPRLDTVEPADLAPGGTASLRGAGFSTTAGENVVLFSGIRAEVVEARGDLLRVRVPDCLPARALSVTVQRGPLRSEARDAVVLADGTDPLMLAPGEAWEVDAPGAPGCLRLAGGGDYAVLLGSASTLAGARYPVTLRTLGGGAATVAGRVGAAMQPPSASSGPRGVDSRVGGSASAWAAEWEGWLRRVERIRPSSEWAQRGFSAPGDPGPAGAPQGTARPVSVPARGDRRTFRVLNTDGEAEEVRAVARWVGDEAVLFVDEEAPVGGFEDGDLRRLSRTFDANIHPVVTGAYGPESDLDGNGRVVVLFTPVVNRLTPRGSDGFVGGFFFGLDLREGDGGNDGEILYAVVPDPEGAHSDPRSRESVLQGVPGVLAHEFQHMVHFHQRALLRGAGSTGALWMAEGLAQMAEELVARDVAAAGGDSVAAVFREGNRIRARRYLADPSGVSLVFSSGRGTLAERGASWLYFLYLEDRWGPPVLGALTRTGDTGIENVEGVTGAAWDSLLMDWWTALLSEEAGSGTEPAFPNRYVGVELAGLLAGADGEPWPLEVPALADGDGLRTDTLAAAAPAYHRLRPASSESTLLRIGGEAQGPVAPGSLLRVRILRVR